MEPWAYRHARENRGHTTVWDLNGPTHCRTCGAMDPFGELVYGQVRSDEEIREEAAAIIRAALV